MQTLDGTRPNIAQPLQEGRDGVPATSRARRRYRSDEFRRFVPAITLEFSQALIELVRNIEPLSPREQSKRLREAVADADQRCEQLAHFGVTSEDQLRTRAYAASLRVLRDLQAQRWSVGTDDDGVFLDPPGASADDDQVNKLAVRESFAFARDAQLRDRATHHFICDMERRGVARLLADGNELAGRLARALETGDISCGVVPVLQMVTPDARDTETGLRLQDIWRYCRHFWSIPYQSTPGRNIFCLVRDEAGPDHPVIGIAALGNPVLQVARRDHALGWSPQALRNRFVSMDHEARLLVGRHLLEIVKDAMDEVFDEDLELAGRTGTEAVNWLWDIERGAAYTRSRKLSKARGSVPDEYRLIRNAHEAVTNGRAETVDWRALAQTDLYRRKRAARLADLHRAIATFSDAHIDSEADAVLWLLAEAGGGRPLHDAGFRAVEIALRLIKQQALSQNVMEIITCGAVPPYRDLLGGKLVAMLLASPAMVKEYQDRYRGRVSLIASAMRGAPKSREPALALLTTSGLYSIGGTQYDSIRIRSAKDQVAYRRLGLTDSFGTIHFAPDTAKALEHLAWMADLDNRRLVNHLFGEGTSPKLRALRAGLDALGLSSDRFLRHHSPRVLYGVRLCLNTDALLLGLADQPQYVLNDRDGDGGVRAISGQWRDRWLRSRAGSAAVRARIAAVRREEFLLGREVAALEHSDVQNASSRSRRKAPGPSLPGEIPDSLPITFVERLYRSANSYADRLTPEELDWIHVDLGLDAYLQDQASKRRQVIVTGNPGDGKTHLIERRRAYLEQRLGAVVLTDANMLHDEQIVSQWRECDSKRRAFVLAINEWPLFALGRLAPTFAPLQEALRQVKEAVYYVNPPKPAKLRVSVIDLSLRNVLAPGIVQEALERLTHERFYQGLHDIDPALQNRHALQNPRVRERLTMLMDRVARTTPHVTMRQLMGFLAYLLTGGRNTSERVKSQGSGEMDYSTLAFAVGEGPFFDQVRKTFDPAFVSHPEYDADLWSGSARTEDWLPGRQVTIGPQQLPAPERLLGYQTIKRRFFFEHDAGSVLIRLVPADEQRFEILLGEGQRDDRALVRDLILELNRFYDPDCSDSERDALVLWQSHRFDARAPEAFVSMHQVSDRALSLQPSRYAEWVERWLPPGQRLPRSFALVAHANGGGVAAQLIVDRELYLTLADAHRGLGRAGWSQSTTRKITRFVDHLHQLVEHEAPVEDVRIRNIYTDLERSFEIERQPPRYRL